MTESCKHVQKNFICTNKRKKDQEPYIVFQCEECRNTFIYFFTRNTRMSQPIWEFDKAGQLVRKSYS